MIHPRLVDRPARRSSPPLQRAAAASLPRLPRSTPPRRDVLMAPLALGGNERWCRHMDDAVGPELGEQVAESVCSGALQLSTHPSQPVCPPLHQGWGPAEHVDGVPVPITARSGASSGVRATRPRCAGWLTHLLGRWTVLPSRSIRARFHTSHGLPYPLPLLGQPGSGPVPPRQHA